MKENTGFKACLLTRLTILISLGLILVLGFNLYFPVARKLSGQRYPALWGWRQAVVLTNSMAPALQPDDLIFIREASSYQPGDILTYSTGGLLITHRLVESNAAGFILQGDANKTPDRPVQPEKILGRTIIRLPYFGRPARWLRSFFDMLDR